MWKKKFIQETQMLLADDSIIEEKDQSEYQFKNSPKYKIQTDKKVGATKIYFTLQKCYGTLLRAGLDQIIELSNEDKNNALYEEKQASEIHETYIGKRDRSKSQKRNYTRISEIPQLSARNFVVNQKDVNETTQSQNSAIKGKTIMSKIQKLQCLIRQTKEEMVINNKTHRKQCDRLPQYPVQNSPNCGQYFYVPRDQNLMSNFQNDDYSNRVYSHHYEHVPKNIKKHAQQRSTMASNKHSIRWQLKKIKQCLKELVVLNKQMVLNLERQKQDQYTQSVYRPGTIYNQQHKIKHKDLIYNSSSFRGQLSQKAEGYIHQQKICQYCHNGLQSR